MTNIVNVTIVGRNSIIREGLRKILEDDNFNVIQSVDCSSSISDSHMNRLIIFDTFQENECMDDIEFIKNKLPESPIILLTDQFDFRTLVRSLQIGVHGYIVKNISCSALIGSLRLVAMGEKVMPTELAKQLLSDSSTNRSAVSFDDLNKNLSDREIEVLRCLITGLPNKVISRTLDICEATVKVHVKSILRKLCVNNRTQAAIFAFDHGLQGNTFPISNANNNNFIASDCR